MAKRSDPNEHLSSERIEKHATRVFVELSRFSEEDAELLFLLHKGLTVEEVATNTGRTRIQVTRLTRYLWRKVFPAIPVASPAYMKVLARALEMLDEAEAIAKRSGQK